MADKIIPIREYADTAANLASDNDVILDRQLVIEKDTGRAKIGDGVTAYNSLDYLFGLSGTTGYIPYFISASSIGNSGMYWDNGHSRLGIGTASPVYKLDLSGGQNAFRFKSNTNIDSYINAAAANTQAFTIYQQNSSDIFRIGFTSAGLGEIHTFNNKSFRFADTNNNQWLYLMHGGNVSIGQVYPTARLHVTGPGSTSATTAFFVENASGADAFGVLDSRTSYFCSTTGYNGAVEVNLANHASRLIKIGQFEFTQGGDPTYTGQGIRVDGANRTFQFRVSNVNTTDKSAFLIGGGGFSPGQGFSSKTSGDIYWAKFEEATFKPTSGSANFAQLSVFGTIDQAGGANGITRGLYIKPTITSAYDWRGIEINTPSKSDVYIGKNTGSAAVDITSTTQGFLPPRMTGTQAEAIPTPAEGLMIYSTDGSGVTITSKGWWGYDGSTWVKLN